MEFLRLDKIISSSGMASRRDIKKLVKSGRITVNGNIISSADQKYNPEETIITVDGKTVIYKKDHIIMLNKPAGYITSTEDLKSKTVMELLDRKYIRMGVFPVGRLDKDTEGLLLLSNNGDFCHNVISPSKKIAKIYYAETNEILTESDSRAFENGIVLADGQKCMPGKLKIIEGRNRSGYVLIYEGKYHQIKRMLASLGKPVTYLKRIAIGGLLMDKLLEKGCYRELAPEEIEIIFNEKKMKEIFELIFE